MTKLFVGIDVSMNDNKVRLLKEDGSDAGKLTVTNNLPGAIKLVDKILQTAGHYSVDKLVVGLESTSHYSYHLATFLKNDQRLAILSPSVHVLNAKSVHRFKSSYNDLPKNDDVDAWVIADKLRFGRLPEEVSVDDRYLALQRLTRTRFHLMQSISREKAFFLNNLFLKFSSLCQDKLFSNQFGATAMAVVEEFLSVDEVATMPLEELVEFIQQKSKNRFSDPEGVAQALKKAARSSYRLSKSLADPVNASLAASASVIRALESEVKKLDKVIAQHLEAIPQTLTSIKGIGPVYAAGIVAEIAGINRFDNHKALAKYAGLVWNEHQSGNWKAEFTPRIKSGNKYLRYYLVESANHIKVHDEEYRQFYLSKYSEATTHKHKRALVLTARKFVRLVFALLRNNQLYNASKRS
ncbi:Transposase [Desulforamulus putei DSM 12395]|uniref:Transposase n=1 Tax=Desulforamulus putei DSM 12395 TaxID=1121429 RepID=A0A1M5D1D8_9FIRM|nr:IS110 family transposase [Desulforamulus putei]SHF60724.1 Transposase [Desulforamulus putei DSM 12395]